jgi:hypothetical protein
MRSEALDYCSVKFGLPIPNENMKGEDEKYWSYVRQFRSDDERTSLKSRLDEMESRRDKMESRLASMEQTRATLVSERSFFVKAQGKNRKS